MWGKMIRGEKDDALVYLSYLLLHGTHVQKPVALAWSVGGAFGSDI